MGHIRYGRLPKTTHFQKVMDMLCNDQASISEISLQTLKAAEKAFDICGDDPSLYYSYWLLTQITWNAKSKEGFDGFLNRIGISSKNTNSAIKLISLLSEIALKESKKLGVTTVFGDMAQMAMREVLAERLLYKTQNLFGSTTEDIRLSLKELSTKKQFAYVSKRFFGNILSRLLKYYINKDASNHIGPTQRFENIDSIQTFETAIDSFSFQSAQIVEEFAGGWYSKRNFQGEISLVDTKKFVNVALAKLHKDLVLEVQDIVR